MIKIELALEILHTRSKTAQDSQKDLTQHLEEETIEVEIKSKLIQLQNKKISSTDLTDALTSVHPTLGGRSDAPDGLYPLDASRNQVKNSIAPVEPTVKR